MDVITSGCGLIITGGRAGRGGAGRPAGPAERADEAARAPQAAGRRPAPGTSHGGGGECITVHAAVADCAPTEWPDSPRVVIKPGGGGGGGGVGGRGSCRRRAGVVAGCSCGRLGRRRRRAPSICPPSPSPSLAPSPPPCPFALLPPPIRLTYLPPPRPALCPPSTVLLAGRGCGGLGRRQHARVGGRRQQVLSHADIDYRPTERP